MKNKGDEAQTVCDSNYCLISGNRVINQIPAMNFILDYTEYSIQLINWRHSLFTEYHCGSGISSDCQSEFSNAQNNGNLERFYYRCGTEGGSDPLRLRCSLCCHEKLPGDSENPVYAGENHIWFLIF